MQGLCSSLLFMERSRKDGGKHFILLENVELFCFPLSSKPCVWRYVVPPPPPPVPHCGTSGASYGIHRLACAKASDLLELRQFEGNMRHFLSVVVKILDL